jgi:hypothetical protein
VSHVPFGGHGRVAADARTCGRARWHNDQMHAPTPNPASQRTRQKRRAVNSVVRALPTMRLLLSVLLLTMSATAASAGEPRPVGTNCELTQPPRGSGEEALRGQKMLIYPRAKSISRTYTGCQSLWAPADGFWVLSSLVYIERGQVVRIWADGAPDDPILKCRFRNGKLVTGSEDVCPSLEFLPHKSLAPGCFEKVRSAINERRPPPSQCREYE